VILCNKSRILFFAKLSVSVGLIVYIGWILDWERAVRTIGDADQLLLLTVPCFLLARVGVAAFRWRLVLADSDVALSCWRAYTGYLVGAFYNVVLPGVTGGDTIRIGRCARQTKCALGTATASVLVERISGLFALWSIAFSVYLFFPETTSSLLATGEISLVKVVAAVGIVLMVAMVLARRLWLRWLPNENAGGVWRFVRSVIEALGILRGRTLGATFALSTLFQAADILVTFLLSRAIGLTVPLTAFFATVPLVYLAVVLPISLGGLGIREGVLTFLLTRFDVAPSDAVALSFLVYLNHVVIGSLGGVVQLVEAVAGKEISKVLSDTNYV
jgi:uncharacterized protein (TIRG00374 family)